MHLLIGNDSIGIRWPDNTPPNDKFSNKLAKIREDRRTDEGRTKLMVPLFCDKILEKFKSGEQYFKSYNSIITEVETIIGVECSDNLLDMIIDALTKELESKDIKVEKISIDGEAGLMINSFE